MNEQLEKLIDLALVDGILTEKETQVLYKKARELNVDKDEFEMILDAKMHLIQKTTAPIKPESSKEGDVKKCPSCAAPVKSFAVQCEDCGHEFRNTEASKNIRQFYDKINNAPPEVHAKIINSFPVSNSKEDILEFLSIAIANITPLTAQEKNSYLETNSLTSFKYRPDLSYREAETLAWQAKFKSVLQKGKISLKDEDSISLISKFEEQFVKETRENARNPQQRRAVLIGVSIFAVLFTFATFMALVEGNGHVEGVKSEKNRLEQIIEEINSDVESKKFDAALVKASSLKWEYSDNYSHKDTKELQKSWDEKRERIIKMIKESQDSNSN